MSVVNICYKAIVELMKEEKSYPFRWNKRLYRDPPRARPQDVQVPGIFVARFKI
jgi:hypothetical protein